MRTPGIAANPVVGRASDRVIWEGGTAAFSETPEIYGAEHLLAGRARDPEVARKLYERIRWWERYSVINAGSMDSNPAPGNKAGGITTILEKSLGAIAKGGTTDLVDVVEYGEPMVGPGLVFMDTPGYDPVSVTGMVAGGAQVVCFTTGRGSVFGCKPVPSIKVASNSPMFNRMRTTWTSTPGAWWTARRPWTRWATSCSSSSSRSRPGASRFSEEMGIGQDEFAPWPMGAVM